MATSQVFILKFSASASLQEAPLHVGFQLVAYFCVKDKESTGVTRTTETSLTSSEEILGFVCSALLPSPQAVYTCLFS